MTLKTSILEQLHKNFIFAVVRGNTKEEGYSISKSCILGGIKNIEVTYTTPEASDVIRQLAEEYKNSDTIIGAGTVLDSETASLAIQSGAKFVVSPHFDPKIAKTCHRYAIPYLPGCGTATEILRAMESGVDVVKLFPGGLLGPSFIENIHGPLPFVEMMPSGGVSIENVDKWIEAGAWSVGVGSALTKQLQTDGIESVEAIAQKFVKKIEEIC
ncbi:hypothetical protein T233_01612 [Vagococcus lutrae LBD1]|uniref:2-dehydro-3-deoxyphosphogluconate aldolase/4-hydroxy-2-oxoglutarate aldolase n=1 Tax=Vagococcus lutrae LBD1 TaxID=1408226 RepID=V6Q221_9ENTE|nr:hypothetical protein T233_01612 [Vagococcus lutrae LBD1]